MCFKEFDDAVLGGLQIHAPMRFQIFQPGGVVQDVPSIAMPQTPDLIALIDDGGQDL